MDRIESMSVIVTIAEAGSLSAASGNSACRSLRSAAKLSDLEGRLKAQLFQRTSRKVSFTDSGRSYVEACKRIIEQSMMPNGKPRASPGLPPATSR